MIRRTFRFGLWLGVLAGLAFALSRLLRPRPVPSTLDLGSRGGSLGSTPDAWPPLEAPMAAPAPVQVPEPDVEPAGEAEGAEEPGLIVIGDEPLQKPIEPPTESAPGTVGKRKAPAKKAAAKKAAATKAGAATKAAAKKTVTTWVDPDNGVCPTTHPVKAKLKSGIFQMPGNFAYDRTAPDRCYRSAADAESDGLRAAKR